MNDGSHDADLNELRELITGPQARQLQELRDRLDDPARRASEVSRILPDALTQRSRDPALTTALGPAVEDAMHQSVRLNPKMLADALFPVMGPAIRKSLAHALAGMLESLTRALDNSLSFEALRWRLEAIRTGKSFAEIVMLHTVLYRVEQVFLIHRETALLLHHAAAGEVVVQDADMMSGMLSAIRDFVQDSLGSQGALDSMQAGELNVWILPGPNALIAAVIRGSAPREFRATLEEAVENIHLRFGDQLANFNGDAAPFVATEPYLEACLREQFREKKRATSPVLRTVVVIALLLLGWWTVAWYRESHRWNVYIARLGEEPGIIVVSADRGWWQHSLSGLRDPLANDPEELLSQSGLNPDHVSSRWEPYQALVPKFIVARAKILLQPPAGVNLSLQNGVLYVKGPVDGQWIADNMRLATALGGVSALRRGESLEAALDRLQPLIEATHIRFPVNSAEPFPDEADHLADLEGQINEVSTAAIGAGHKLQIDILGFADAATGTPQFNMQLSQTRADRIRSLIGDLPGIEILAKGQGSRTSTDKNRAAEERQVTIRVSRAGRRP